MWRMFNRTWLKKATKDIWHIWRHKRWIQSGKGGVYFAKATWQEKGPAETQLSLLKQGFSTIDNQGNIKHVGNTPPVAEEEATVIP